MRRTATVCAVLAALLLTTGQAAAATQHAAWVKHHAPTPAPWHPTWNYTPRA